MDRMTYEAALKKAKLVERNPNPNGTSIIDLYRVSAHQETDILSLAQQIETADELLKDRACGKLTIILEQIKLLQKQAQQILEETSRDSELHNAACNFTKKPGNIYHLYCKSTGQKYFSMLSPEEWNGSCNQTHIGSYRLEHDFSWTPVDEISKRDINDEWAKRLLSAKEQFTINNAPPIEYK